jgi:mediator of RNA polymerase II transcription subunit 12
VLKDTNQRICVALPDTFVSPSAWLAHSSLLCSALAGPADIGPSNCRRRDFQQLLSDNLKDIQRRNDAMLFRNLPPRKLERLGSLVVDIQILNSICSSTDMSTISFFSSQIPDCTSSSSFVDKLDTLLTWAVTPLQYGSHRPYAAVTLLRAYHERNARRELSSATLHDHLFDWLDSKPVVREAGNLRAVAGLFGKLMKGGLFDYAAYVQRLVARGEEGLSLNEVYRMPNQHCCLTKIIFSLTKRLPFIVTSFAGYHYITQQHLFQTSGKLSSTERAQDRPLRMSVNVRCGGKFAQSCHLYLVVCKINIFIWFLLLMNCR